MDTARLDIIADGHTHTHTPKYEILCIELRYGGVQKKGRYEGVYDFRGVTRRHLIVLGRLLKFFGGMVANYRKVLLWKQGRKI